MSTFLIPPSGWSADNTNEENQIRAIFYSHWKKAMGQFLATVNEINAWRQKAIEDINTHADEQIRILTGDYDRQRVSFDEKYQENLEITHACGAQNAELFNELQNACQLLEFQIVQLEYVIGTMNAVKVVTVHEQMERKKKEHSDASRSQDNKPEEKPIIEPTNNIQDDQSAKKDEYNNSASVMSNATQPHSSVGESSNDNNQSISNNNECQARIIHDDGLINKCPVCFMIFPLSMTQDERSQHVNEHYTDD